MIPRAVVLTFAAILLSLWTGGGSAEAQTASDADPARAVEAYAAADFPRPETLLEQVDSASRPYNVGSVLFSSLIPGLGQIRTGKRVRGVLTMATAAGAAALGVFSDEHHQLCAVPAEGTCPEGDVLETWVEKPYRAVGLGAAAAVTILGAIDAGLTASRSNRQAEAPRPSSEVGTGSSLRIGAAPDGLRIGLDLRF